MYSAGLIPWGILQPLAAIRLINLVAENQAKIESRKTHGPIEQEETQHQIARLEKRNRELEEELSRLENEDQKKIDDLKQMLKNMEDRTNASEQKLAESRKKISDGRQKLVENREKLQERRKLLSQQAKKTKVELLEFNLLAELTEIYKQIEEEEEESIKDSDRINTLHKKLKLANNTLEKLKILTFCQVRDKNIERIQELRNEFEKEKEKQKETIAVLEEIFDQLSESIDKSKLEDNKTSIDNSEEDQNS